MHCVVGGEGESNECLLFEGLTLQYAVGYQLLLALLGTRGAQNLKGSVPNLETYRQQACIELSFRRMVASAQQQTV